MGGESMRYLAIGDSKTIKGTKKGYMTGVMYLAPAWEARAAGHHDVKKCVPVRVSRMRALVFIHGGPRRFLQC